MIITYSIILCISHFVINKLITGSKNKIFLIFGLNLFFIILFYDKYIVDLILYYICLQFLFINIYTIRYSSIRYLILDRLIKRETLPDEEWLYLNRTNRLNNNSDKDKKIIKQNNIFYILRYIMKVFNFFFK